MTPLWAQVRGWFLQTLERAGIEPRMGLQLHHCFRDAGLPAPALSLEAAVIGGPDAPVWGWASLLTGVLPLMEQFGIATGRRGRPRHPRQPAPSRNRRR